jgi:Protein of unknown function (DUF1475)
MQRLLVTFFALVLGVMLWVTTAATLERGVFTALADLWADAWFRATLCDAYFAFLTVFLWLAWRERSWWRGTVWLVLLLVLGNIAIAGYFLWALTHLKSGETWEALFRQREAR